MGKAEGVQARAGQCRNPPGHYGAPFVKSVLISYTSYGRIVRSFNSVVRIVSLEFCPTEL